ncbi:hypothetical protein DYB31_016530, partial [Aphanomyces astaci]
MLQAPPTVEVVDKVVEKVIMEKGISEEEAQKIADKAKQEIGAVRKQAAEELSAAVKDNALAEHNKREMELKLEMEQKQQEEMVKLLRMLFPRGANFNMHVKHMSREDMCSDNWNSWQTAFKGRMLSKKLKAVYDAGVALANERGLAATNDGNVTTPARTNTHDSAYSDDNDAYALGILLTCCSESQQQYVAEADTYGEAWCALAKHHEPKTRVDRLATLSEYFNMKWNTKQESLPQFLERYEIVLRKLKASGDAVHDSMVVDRLLDMLPWQMRAVTHQVHAMPMAQSQNLATVRVLLEAEYKAAI